MEDVDVGRQDGVGVSHRVCNKDNAAGSGNCSTGDTVQVYSSDTCHVCTVGIQVPQDICPVRTRHVQPPFFYIEYTT